MQAHRQTTITPHHIAALAETFEDEEIAEILCIPLGLVRTMLARSQKPRRRWHVRCNRTGRQIETRSQRGAYRMVCLLGWTDWDWWPEATKGGQA